MRCALLFLFFLSTGHSLEAMGSAGEALSDDAVVAERGGARLTVGNMRTKLRASLPPEARREFFADGAKVAKLIDDLLAAQQLAAVARAEGLDKSPEIAAEIEDMVVDFLARRQIAHHMEGLEQPDYEILARERYLANKSKYTIQAARNVRHILIFAEDRSDEEAVAIAREAREALLSGDDFQDVFEKYSEDPAREFMGLVSDVQKQGRYDPVFTEAVYALKKIGDISPPVRTPFGYHVIRLDSDVPESLRSFEEVKQEIVEEIQIQQRSAARQAYIEKFTSQPLEFNDEVMQKLPTAEP